MGSGCSNSQAVRRALRTLAAPPYIFSTRFSSPRDRHIMHMERPFISCVLHLKCRFERRIFIPLPKVQAREQLLRAGLGGTPHHLSEADFRYLARELEGSAAIAASRPHFVGRACLHIFAHLYHFSASLFPVVTREASCRKIRLRILAENAHKGEIPN